MSRENQILSTALHVVRVAEQGDAGSWPDDEPIVTLQLVARTRPGVELTPGEVAAITEMVTDLRVWGSERIGSDEEMLCFRLRL